MTRQELNVQTIQALFQDIGKGDIPTAMSRFVEDAEMFLSGPRKKRPPYIKGRNEIFKALGEGRKEGAMKMEIQGVAANDDQAFTMLKVKAEKGGRTLDQQMIIVWKFRDGKICEMREFYWDAVALVDFWERD